MRLCLINHDCRYETEKLIRIFLPFEKIEFSKEEDVTDFCLVTKIDHNFAFAKLYFSGFIYENEQKIENINNIFSKDAELFLAIAVYNCFFENFL